MKDKKIEIVTLNEYYKKIFKSADPIIDDHDNAFEIYVNYENEAEKLVEYVVLFNPMTFDGINKFMYISTSEDIYMPYEDITDVKNFIDNASYEKFIQAITNSPQNL